MIEKTSKPRRWWWALLLAAAPPVGFLYVGRPKWFLGLFCALAVFGLTPSLAPGGALATPEAVLLMFSFGAAFYVGPLIATVRLAILEKDYAPRWYNRWWLYLGAIALVIMLNVLLPFETKLKGSVETFRASAGSMSPTIRHGEYWSCRGYGGNSRVA